MRILDIDFMIESIPKIIQGIPTSLEIVFVALFFGSLLGLGSALARIYNVPVLKQISSTYVSFMRGMPMLVQILIFYYGIPTVLKYISYKTGIAINVNTIPAIVFMFLCYSLCMGAYLSEIIRSSILAVDPGQMEACYSIGMTTRQGMFTIVLPQAMKTALPNILNTFISFFKDTSLCFSVGIVEVLGQAKILAGRTNLFFEAYLVAGIIYLLMCKVLEIIVAYLENKSRKFEVR